MPSDDKKGLPTLITKGIGTDISRREFGKGLTGIATEIATGPLIDKGISTLNKNNPNIKIKETVPLLEEYFNIKHKIDNLVQDIYGSYDKWYKDPIIREDIYLANNLYSKYNESIVEEHYNKKKLKKALNDLKELGITFGGDVYDDPFGNVNVGEKEFDQYTMSMGTKGQNLLTLVNQLYEEQKDILENQENYLNRINKDLSPKGKKLINQLTKYKNDQNTIRLIAQDKKIPFNFFETLVKNTFEGDPKFGERHPELKVNIKKHIRETIDNVVNENKKRYSDSLEIIKKLSTPSGLNEAIEEEFQMWKSLPTRGIPGWENSTRGMTTEQANNWQKEEIKENLISRLKYNKSRFENAETDRSEDRNYDHDRVGGRLSNSIDSSNYSLEPSERKNLLNEVQETFLDISKDIAKDYVKDKFITREGKPGSFTKKIADVLKQFKTVKSSSTSVESDKVRAEKAKEVKEVKQQPKQDIKQQPKAKEKPIRNLGQDLLGIGKRLKYSPLGTAFYTKEFGDAELPLETSPRGYGMRRENKGRSSKDYYKSYNTQRLI